MRSLALPVALGVLVALGACRKTQGVDHGEPGQVRISTDHTVRHGDVGFDAHATSATYVLVDAENVSDGDLDVTLGGALLDASGAEVGTLRAESLRIPGGARRTFALVDARDRAVPAAATARIEIEGVSRPRWKPTASVSDGHRFDDRGRPQVAATITNDADRPGTLIVFAAFHDADGRPVARPFDVLRLGPRASKTVRFVGPAGAAGGTIYLGDSTY